MKEIKIKEILQIIRACRTKDGLIRIVSILVDYRQYFSMDDLVQILREILYKLDNLDSK